MTRPRQDFEPVRAGHTFQVILAVIREIPRGHTASYADVAQRALGSRSAARTVGWALSRCPADVPWWRVIRASGALPGVHDALQARLLRSEGVSVRSTEGDGRVLSPRSATRNEERRDSS
jgi:alkylated DNA nucleotide flippase Atl1